MVLLINLNKLQNTVKILKIHIPWNNRADKIPNTDTRLREITVKCCVLFTFDVYWLTSTETVQSVALVSSKSRKVCMPRKNALSHLTHMPKAKSNFSEDSSSHRATIIQIAAHFKSQFPTKKWEWQHFWKILFLNLYWYHGSD